MYHRRAPEPYMYHIKKREVVMIATATIQVDLWQSALWRQQNPVDWIVFAGQIPGAKLIKLHTSNCTIRLPEISLADLDALIKSQQRGISRGEPWSVFQSRWTTQSVAQR